VSCRRSHECVRWVHLSIFHPCVYVRMPEAGVEGGAQARVRASMRTSGGCCSSGVTDRGAGDTAETDADERKTCTCFVR
jgi:hypothetical protein